MTRVAWRHAVSSIAGDRGRLEAAALQPPAQLGPGPGPGREQSEGGGVGGVLVTVGDSNYLEWWSWSFGERPEGTAA